jgi:hypothetical protein
MLQMPSESSAADQTPTPTASEWNTGERRSVKFRVSDFDTVTEIRDVCGRTPSISEGDVHHPAVVIASVTKRELEMILRTTRAKQVSD